MKIHSNAPQSVDPIRAHRVHDAAQKFEAVLLEQILGPLAKQDDNSSQNNVMSSYGVEALAGSIARQGGLGFAQQIEAQFKNK